MVEKIKSVIDTSVYIAALKSKSRTSAPVKVINNLHEGNFNTIISLQLLAEIIEIGAKKSIAKNDVVQLLQSIKNNIIKISGDYIVNTLDDIDTKDNILLSAALEAKADYIISLDRRDVLPLKHYKGTQIVAPTQFLHTLKDYKEGKYKRIETMIYQEVSTKN